MTTRAPIAVAVLVMLAAAGCTSTEPEPQPATWTQQHGAWGSRSTPTAPASPTPSPTQTTPAPASAEALPHDGDPGHPDAAAAADADAVADAVASTGWAHDTATDTTPTDALLRAGHWLTEDYVAALREYPGGGGADWLELTAHQGYTTVDVAAVVDAGQPPDTATTAERARALALTPIGRDGWVGEPSVVVAFLTLTRSDGGAPWLVSTIRIG